VKGEVAKRIEIALAVVVLLVLVAIPVVAFRYQAARAASSDAILLVGHAPKLVGRTPKGGNWSQRSIQAQVGKPLTLRLTSEDVTHGFYLPAFKVESGPIRPGTFRTVTFTPDRPGRFRFYCNIMCSKFHGFMVGEIVVTQ
jgi:heme/copper-type cytochrome/quinol oxidase subunit 2